MRFPPGTFRTAEPWIPLEKEAVAGLRTSATAFHMGMIRNPRSMWPFLLNKWLAPDEIGGRDTQMTRGSEFGTANQLDLCESGRIIRGLEWRSALWNALPPETSPARSAGSLFDGMRPARRLLGSRLAAWSAVYGSGAVWATSSASHSWNAATSCRHEHNGGALKAAN